MGTLGFAVPRLRTLPDARHEVCGIFTQPGKPKGWGYALAPPPVKESTLERGIPVYQPAILRTLGVATLVVSFPPEVAIVVAYGKLLPKEILQLSLHGRINVHTPLLLKYHSATSIQWAVINGDEVTGVVTVQMDEELDTGDTLLVEETKIGENEVSGESFNRLRELDAQVLVETLRQLKAGTLKRRPQGNGGANYASMFSRELSVIDWSCFAQEVHNPVHGLSPWPVAHSVYQDKRIKIYQTQVCGDESGEPGQVLPGKGFLVCCGQNTASKLMTIQYEGGKRINGSDLLQGYPVLPEARVGP